MAVVKVVLRKKLNKDGTYPLAIRITKDRKSSFIHLDYRIKESDWDKKNGKVKKSHPNSTRLNNYLLKKLAEANENSLELETGKAPVTAKIIRQDIKPKSGGSVFAQADLYIDRLEQDGKFNQWSANKPRVKHLKEFLKRDMAFQELTVALLERYKAWLKAHHKVSERTAVNHLSVVRSIFSQAIKEKVCDAKYYPFGKGKIKIVFPDTQKQGLTIEEVNRVEQAELTGDAHHARNVWLISFYFAGMRVSDVLRLKWSDFQDGRFYYAMGKNNKGDSLKVNDRALKILAEYEPYKRKASDVIFPELKTVDLTDNFETQKIIASRNHAIDNLLKTVIAPAAEITKPLTMHIARHSFGNISGDKIPIQMLQKLYRHSSITTTIGYQANFIHKDVDEALEAVLGI
ncbi:MAG: phage integrase SAM-like domain-containing protein [Flavipsychrobacter sp.]